MAARSPADAVPRAQRRASAWGSATAPVPKAATGRPTKRAKDPPVRARREQYRRRSAAAQEKGRELDRAWYSFTGSCSAGTGHSVSGGVPFRNDDEEEEEEAEIGEIAFFFFLLQVLGLELVLGLGLQVERREGSFGIGRGERRGGERGEVAMVRVALWTLLSLLAGASDGSHFSFPFSVPSQFGWDTLWAYYGP